MWTIDIMLIMILNYSKIKKQIQKLKQIALMKLMQANASVQNPGYKAKLLANGSEGPRSAANRLVVSLQMGRRASDSTGKYNSNLFRSGPGLNAKGDWTGKDRNGIE